LPSRSHAQLYNTVLDNLKLEFFSAGDVHGEERKFKMYLRDVQAESRCQLFVATGDYLAQPEFDVGKASDEILPLLETLRAANKPVLLLGGNYDPLGVTATVAEKLGDPFLSIGGTRQMESGVLPGDARSFFGYDFIGCEGTNPINGRFPGERSEEEMKTAVTVAMNKVPNYDPTRTVLLTHAPPFQSGGRDELGKFGLPQPYWGKHVGSTALKDLLYEHRPLLIVSGHIHEGVGATVYQWEDGGEPKVHDIRMQGSPHRILAVIKKDKRLRLSVVVNHGTIEYWEYFRFRMAEKDDVIMMEVCKRRLAGKDPITKFFDTVSGKGHRPVYEQVFDPDNLLPSLIQFS